MFGGGQEDVFVHLEGAACAILAQIDALGAAEALKFVGLHDEAADLTLLGILGRYLVVEIVLAGDAQCHGLELHVEVLGDEDHRCLLLLEQADAGGDDLVIHGVAIGEDF